MIFSLSGNAIKTNFTPIVKNELTELEEKYSYLNLNLSKQAILNNRTDSNQRVCINTIPVGEKFDNYKPYYLQKIEKILICSTNT